MIPKGGFRLHWDEPAHYYEDFTCLNDALNHAAVIYATDQGTLTRLENWLGEDACPPDQLIATAHLRTKETRMRHDHEAMESNAEWGSFA
jgi:hypothetical protein